MLSRELLSRHLRPPRARSITQDEYDKKARELKERQAEIATCIDQHQQGDGEYRTRRRGCRGAGRRSRGPSDSARRCPGGISAATKSRTDAAAASAFIDRTSSRCLLRGCLTEKIAGKNRQTPLARGDLPLTEGSFRQTVSQFWNS